MQHIHIKKEVHNGKNIFVVPALTFKKNNNTIKQQIPHPLGTHAIEFETIEDAIKAIELSGFPYILPDGENRCTVQEFKPADANLDAQVEAALLNCVKDGNTAVCASAISSLGEMKNKDYLPIFVDKMGEDNELIRGNAIEALVNFGAGAAEITAKSLADENWVRRKSAITVIERLVQTTSVNPEMFLYNILKLFNDPNNIVKCAAISAVGKLYKAARSK